MYYCSYAGTLITKPNPPVVKLLTSPDIPATGTVTVSWDSVYDAKYYKAVLYNSSGAEVKAYGDLYGTTATFTPQDEGVYTVKVYAQNSMYTSDPGVLSQAITVHGKSKVTYLDDNGDVLGTQDVSYNNSSTAPIAPEKEGYTFYGWVDENDSNKSASLNNITGAKTVKAKYTKNKYSVMFLDKDGKQLGDVQQVEYHESAVAPEAPEIDGYIFSGWSSDDYKNVYRLNKSEVIKIYPVYIWENKEIPVTCTITEASRQKDGYYVIFDVENHVDDSTRGRAVVCLKTKSDKLVYTTESAAFSIPGQTKKTGMEVFVPCESAATKAEVIILDNFENSIPISESVSSSIDQSNMWSAWTDYETLPDFDSDTEYETRTVYSYRIKETTTNYTNTKEGYTLYGTRTEHPGSYSAWSDSVIDPFDYPDRTRRVETQTVNVYSSRTIFDYFHYYNPSKARWSPVQYSGYTQWHACNLTWQLAWKGNSSVSGWSYYGSNYCGSCGAYNMWYPNGSHSESYVSGQKTQYKYYDTTYTYYFYRWGEWSDWQTTPVLENDNREVETKTQYRTKSVSAAVEDDSGEIKTVSGTLDSSLAGKYVNLYVTKYIDNSDWTNEYVGQTVIGSDGSYSFSFKLREEPSAATGDMTAYIGIQGTDEMQAVKVFEAPKAIYKVEYYDDNEGGKIISTQYVEDGDTATVPAVNPEKEGYIFAGWNNTCTNVKSDMTVRPIFVEQKCTVQYIDPRNPDNNKEQICNHGDTFETPEINDSNRECESGYLVGWDSIERTVINDDETESTIPGEKFVTSNMVVMAEYETKNFDITFVGVNGEIIDTQSVEYEGYVEAPEFPEDDSVDFIAWDVDEEELASVTDSITVNAIYYFDETTQTPEASLATGAYEGTQTVTLSCGTPDAVIWYTLD
ncbi:MAG: InlB B-repeat-containing protein, partial [Acutalibacteraceae bacterium]